MYKMELSQQTNVLTENCKNNTHIKTNKTNFEKVVEFNKSFGVSVSTTPQTNIVIYNPKLTKLRLDLIQEETKELQDAVKTNDFTEIVDALSDILYVVYGAGASFGIDLDKTFDIVHRSNMSKLCVSEEEAQQTVTWYMENMLETYDSPAYRKSDDDTYWIVFNKNTGKILKSINYTPADFSKVI